MPSPLSLTYFCVTFFLSFSLVKKLLLLFFFHIFNNNSGTYENCDDFMRTIPKIVPCLLLYHLIMRITIWNHKLLFMNAYIIGPLNTILDTHIEKKIEFFPRKAHQSNGFAELDLSYSKYFKYACAIYSRIDKHNNKIWLK